MSASHGNANSSGPLSPQASANCAKQKLASVTDAENIKNQVLEKLGLNSEEQKEDTNYLDGIQGLLKTKDGQQLNLDNIGTTPLAEKVKTKACDLVLKQGLNFIS